MGGNSDTVVPTEKAVVTYVTTALSAGSGTAFKLKDAQDDTGINVDTVGNGSANTIVMTTNGSTRLTIGSTGQITAASTYAPSTTYDLVTKTYVDTAIGALSSTTLTEGNTSFEVDDTGTGSITATVDGTLRLTINASGVSTNGVNFVGNVTGNVSGSAGSVAAANITGNTLASGVTASSLTSVGSLASLTVSGAVNLNGNTTLGDATSDTITVTGRVASNVLPSADNTYNLGSASFRWANVYTGDLHLRNHVGDWTVIEGENNLYIKNNNTNKSYKFVLSEVDPTEVPQENSGRPHP
jgi:hypothetical protein